MIVILYIVDSLRADFLSCYGSSQETSPNIDALARESVLFSNAFAQSTWTRAVGASLLSSLYPSVNGVRTHEDFVPPYVPTLPEVLKKKGFYTVALSAMGNISHHFGFGRGFDRFVELYKEPRVREKRRRVPVKGTGWETHFHVDTDDVPIATSEDINDYIFGLSNQMRQEDVFIFVWSIDTHAPYFHRDPELRRFAPPDHYVSCEDVATMADEEELDLSRAIYRDMIYYNDHHIGVLVKNLKEMGLFEEAFWIVTGDHGEAFGEHGVTSHGKVPHDEQIRVPLIMKFPFSRFTGEVSSIVQHIDIVPTVLDWLKIPKDTMLIQGRSILPTVRDHLKVNEYAFTEYQLKNHFTSYISVRTEDYKYIAAKQPGSSLARRIREKMKLGSSPSFRHKPAYLYNLKSDPKEKLNLVYSEKKKTRRFHAIVKTFFDDNRKMMERLERQEPRLKDQRNEQKSDEEVTKQLKALGYFE